MSAVNESGVSGTELKEKAIRRSIHHTDCVINSAHTIDTLYHDKLDVLTVADKLTQSLAKINDGNIQEIEAMLMTQAHTLNTLFHRTISQIPNINMINQIQVFSDIALRAQNQARKTLAVLAELKNPRRTTFIKNQNNALNQQVNVTPNSDSSKNLEKTATELVNEVLNEKMDDRRTAKTIPNHTKKEALAILNRPANTRR